MLSEKPYSVLLHQIEGKLTPEKGQNEGHMETQ